MDDVQMRKTAEIFIAYTEKQLNNGEKTITSDLFFDFFDKQNVELLDAETCSWWQMAKEDCAGKDRISSEPVFGFRKKNHSDIAAIVIKYFEDKNFSVDYVEEEKGFKMVPVPISSGKTTEMSEPLYKLTFTMKEKDNS